jgi:hypothetical protein
MPKGASKLLVLVLARLVLVGRLVWLLLVLVKFVHITSVARQASAREDPYIYS